MILSILLSPNQYGMKPGKIVALLSTTTALMAGAIAYFEDLVEKSDPPWLIGYALQHKCELALALFALTCALACADWHRSSKDRRVGPCVPPPLPAGENSCRIEHGAVLFMEVGERHTMYF